MLCSGVRSASFAVMLWLGRQQFNGDVQQQHAGCLDVQMFVHKDTGKNQTVVR